MLSWPPTWPWRRGEELHRKLADAVAAGRFDLPRGRKANIFDIKGAPRVEAEDRRSYRRQASNSCMHISTCARIPLHQLAE